MNKLSQYYTNGFLKSEFKPGKLLDTFNKTLHDLHVSNHMRAGFKWEEKYPNTQDIRPSAFALDVIFLDILFENNIPQLLKATIDQNLTLSHVQIRKVGPGPSYMDWHRDSYYVDDNLIGNMPPVHKIIFYPQVTKQQEIKLHILKGSHLCVVNQPKTSYLSPGFSTLDKQLFQIMECISYESSNREFILFNTSALHAVVPDTNVEGSIRIVYSFIHPDLYKEKYDHKDIHSKLNKEYEKRKGLV